MSLLPVSQNLNLTIIAPGPKKEDMRHTRDHEPLRISADLDTPLLKLAPCSFKNKTIEALPLIDTVYVSPAIHIGVFQRLNLILDFPG